MSIAIHDGARPAPPLAPDRNENRHTVEPAQSLSDIANHYGVSVQDILTANPGIHNPDMVYPQQELTIPARVTNDPSVSVSNDGSRGVSNTRSEHVTSTSEDGTTRQSSTSATGGISVNP